MRLNIILAALLLGGVISCSKQLPIIQVHTSIEESFVEFAVPLSASEDIVKETLIINTKEDSCYKQKVDGFGACFNELGWVSLSRLNDTDRNSIMKELFEPDTGANFTLCRMPVGANDFSRDWYSYNETDGDFEMKGFSIEQDKETLIPFIHTARKYNPNIRIWASPWSPPTWMKKNKHYAMRPSYEGTPEQYQNGLQPWQRAYEGEDLFILEDRYLSAYADYFGLFIDAYKSEGIDIYGVMPQNEFNSDQVFPSCCWTAKALANFIGDYLAREMEKRGVDVMLGTMERSDWRLVDTILKDPKAGPFIKAVGFQWAGKDAIGKVHENYPAMPLYQTEQECGDGKNNWPGLVHSWDLLKHYFDNGVSVYNYWNISLDKGGVSRWGWAQNSLVVVDPEDSSYHYTYEYYLMKHISHFVKPEATLISTSGSAVETLTFVNKDKSIVILYMEKDGFDKQLSIDVNGKQHVVNVKSNSISTFVI